MAEDQGAKQEPVTASYAIGSVREGNGHGPVPRLIALISCPGSALREWPLPLANSVQDGAQNAAPASLVQPFQTYLQSSHPWPPFNSSAAAPRQGRTVHGRRYMLHTIIRVIVAVAAMTAAVLWFNSARIEVPDSIDTIVQELQRVGYWNGWAARCSCFAVRGG